jgi:hypothetical protein
LYTPFDSTLFWRTDTHSLILLENALTRLDDDTEKDHDSSAYLLGRTDGVEHNSDTEHIVSPESSSASPGSSPASSNPSSLSTQSSSFVQSASPTETERSSSPIVQIGRTYRCEYPGCCKILHSRGSFTKHYNNHIKPHKCPLSPCSDHNIGFACSKDLKRHRETVHGEGTERIFCPFPSCEYAVNGSANGFPKSRADNLRRHMRTKNH